MNKGTRGIVAVVLIGSGLDETVPSEVRDWAPDAEVVVATSPHDAIRHLGETLATDTPAAESATATEAGLTQREHEVLIALADGQTPSSIARDLDIALSTARGHVKQLREKLECTSTLQAVVTGARMGLIPGVLWSRDPSGYIAPSTGP